MRTGCQFSDHHSSRKFFQTNAATFPIFVIIIAKPFRSQHRDFLLGHSHVPMPKRINDINPQCGESAQEERKSTLPRTQVEKWIEVDFEPVVAQSKGGYRRTWHRSSGLEDQGNVSNKANGVHRNFTNGIVRAVAVRQRSVAVVQVRNEMGRRRQMKVVAGRGGMGGVGGCGDCGGLQAAVGFYDERVRVRVEAS
nr:hypothetical protein Iba_chr12aCG7570 [Ipomoea batatas]